MYKHYIQIGMARKARMITAEILQDIFEESDTELDEEDSFSDCGPIVEGSDDDFDDLCEDYIESDCESERDQAEQQLAKLVRACCKYYSRDTSS